MNTIQDSPEFTFCETVINRLCENENLRPLVPVSYTHLTLPTKA